jgi:peptidylprolyl isomerase
MKRYLILLLVVAALLVGSCGGDETVTPTPTPTPTQEGKAQAEIGDTVRVHYTGTLDDGTEFDSSIGREPLQFTVGAGQMIPGFEQAVIGMRLGESETVIIPTDQAYGPYHEELVVVVPREQLPPDVEPEVGQQLTMSQPDGQPVPVTVIDVSEGNVTIDANHSLAGEDLTFDIELVEIL